ncbi:MAG: methylated-DNA--[Firmicutes bacterium]|nr:methylated-DNA--[protein]-cysteine S-methyltransferase [Bacillota bacterium]
MYRFRYETPEGFSDLLMISEGEFLNALVFAGSGDMDKYPEECEEKMLPIFEETSEWLDIYFSGKDPGFLPKLHFTGLSDMRAEVIERMLRIPFGESVTYGQIAAEIGAKRGISKMSAQAVGGAVGSNPVCIIVPCHRVLGAKGRLTGYGGGLENKKALLRLEGIEFR